jgi:hypothetical protein
MLIEALLGRFVVVGGDEQGSLGSGLLCVAGEAHRFGRAVGPGPRDDGDSSPGFLDGDVHDPIVLAVGEGGRLAGGAARNNPVNPLPDLPVDQLSERVLVELPVAEGGDQGCDGASKHRASWAGGEKGIESYQVTWGKSKYRDDQNPPSPLREHRRTGETLVRNPG